MTVVLGSLVCNRKNLIFGSADFLLLLTPQVLLLRDNASPGPIFLAVGSLFLLFIFTILYL